MSKICKLLNLTWEIDIKVNNEILRNFMKRSTMLQIDFEVPNYNVDIVGGHSINLFSKSGTGSVRMYLEDLVYGIKNWCRYYGFSAPLHGHRLYLDELKTEDINYILDDAIVHSLQIEGGY